MSAADSSAIVISVSGEEREVTAKTAAELFADDPKIVVARVNGVLVDLSHELSAGDSVEPVFIHEPDGLNVLRHSAAHVMAQAVQEYPFRRQRHCLPAAVAPPHKHNGDRSG